LAIHFYPEYFGNGNPGSIYLHLSSTAGTGHLGALSQAYFFQHLFGVKFAQGEGAAKVMCHLMFGILALMGNQMMCFLE